MAFELDGFYSNSQNSVPQGLAVNQKQLYRDFLLHCGPVKCCKLLISVVVRELASAANALTW